MLICKKCATAYGGAFGEQPGTLCGDSSGWGGTAMQPCQGRLEQVRFARQLLIYRRRCLRTIEPAGWGTWRCGLLNSHPAAQTIAPWLRGLFYACRADLPTSSSLHCGGALSICWSNVPAAVGVIAQRFVLHQLQLAIDGFYQQLPQICAAEHCWDREAAFDPQWTAQPFMHRRCDMRHAT